MGTAKRRQLLYRGGKTAPPFDSWGRGWDPGITIHQKTRKYSRIGVTAAEKQGNLNLLRVMIV